MCPLHCERPVKSMAHDSSPKKAAGLQGLSHKLLDSMDSFFATPDPQQSNPPFASGRFNRSLQVASGHDGRVLGDLIGGTQPPHTKNDETEAPSSRSAMTNRGDQGGRTCSNGAMVNPMGRTVDPGVHLDPHRRLSCGEPAVALFVVLLGQAAIRPRDRIRRSPSTGRRVMERKKELIVMEWETKKESMAP